MENSMKNEKTIKNLNGHLMSQDSVIGIIRNGTLEITDEKRAPLFFRKSNDLEQWLKDRAIDTHRTHSRILRKMLRIGIHDDVSTSLHVCAATLTDSYWIREEGSDRIYADIRSWTDGLSPIALQGNLTGFSEKTNTHSPELTNTGSFEKCWKKEKDGWWMYKKGTEDELFSEQFVCELGKRLGMDMAEYQLTEGYIRTRDFTENGKYNLEAISGTEIGDDDDYGKNYEFLSQMSEAMAGKYLQMIYLDTLVYNVDRHTNNYGFLRDPDTGETLDLAPNFDNNMALLARKQNIDIERDKDAFLNFFTGFLEENEKARKHFLALEIPRITEDDIHAICAGIGMEVPEAKIARFVENAQNIILQRVYLQEKDMKAFLETPKLIPKRGEETRTR